MPRFAILIHDHPFLHWDLLLENGKKCRTFRLLVSPDGPQDAVPAEAIADHRLLYLDYEGPVSAGRGNVKRWDCGTFEWQINRVERCEVVLNGQRWKGFFRLSQENDAYWTCFRERSEDSINQ